MKVTLALNRLNYFKDVIKEINFTGGKLHHLKPFEQYKQTRAFVNKTRILKYNTRHVPALTFTETTNLHTNTDILRYMV